MPIVLAGASGGVVVGALAGWRFGRVSESIFWSLLSLSLAALCIAGQPYVGTVPMMGWPLAGAMAGAFAGAYPPGWLRAKLTTCVVAGVLPLIALTSLRPTLEQWGDVALAVVVSLLLAALSELFTWARARYHTSYGGWAASLVLAVILGNWGAAWFAPIWTNLLAGG